LNPQVNRIRDESTPIDRDFKVVSDDAALVPTETERRVLRALVEHCTMAEAANQIGMNVHTMSNHVRSMRYKSGYRYLHQIVRWAIANDWLDDADLPL
jgi:DNA-binding CsgD family transcriptional regulator